MYIYKITSYNPDFHKTKELQQITDTCDKSGFLVCSMLKKNVKDHTNGHPNPIVPVGLESYFRQHDFVEVRCLSNLKIDCYKISSIEEELNDSNRVYRYKRDDKIVTGVEGQGEYSLDALIKKVDLFKFQFEFQDVYGIDHKSIAAYCISSQDERLCQIPFFKVKTNTPLIVRIMVFNPNTVEWNVDTTHNIPYSQIEDHLWRCTFTFDLVKKTYQVWSTSAFYTKSLN